MKRIALFFALLTLISCATIKRPQSKFPKIHERILSGSYEEIWVAALQVLDAHRYQYPKADKDAGIVETSFIKGSSKKAFHYAGGQKFPKDLQWKLKLWILALPAPITHPQVRVKIEKETYVSAGPPEGWQRTQTDLLEEKSLIYRIGRMRDLNRLRDRAVTP